MKKYFNEITYFLNNKLYLYSCILVAIISFGYSAVHTTVSIDDFNGERYIGESGEFWQAGRFALAIFPKLLGYGTKWVHNSYAIEILGIVFLILAATMYCVLFRRVTKNKINFYALLSFSCILISYPLMNEIWEYTSTNCFICVDFFLVAFALLLVWEQLCEGFKIKKSLLASTAIMLTISSYESFAVVYIFSVFAVIFLELLFENRKITLKEVMKKGSIYAIFLLFGLVLRILVHQVLLFVLNLEKGTNGATKILWGNTPVKEILYQLFWGWIDLYMIRGMIYFPIFELMLGIIAGSGLCLFLVLKKRNILILFSGMGMFFSLFLFSIIQGSVTPYRACQVFAVFVAFVGMVLVHIGFEYCKQGVAIALFAATLLLSLYQAFYLNYFLTLNHLRYEEESHVICDIGTDVQKNYDVSKPVIFVGEYNLSESIVEASSISKEDVRYQIHSYMYAKVHGADYEFIYDNTTRKIPSTNVNSVINWSLGRQADIQKLFYFNGFSFKIMEDVNIVEEAKSFVKSEEIPSYPNDGYIVDKGKYIVVNIN